MNNFRNFNILRQYILQILLKNKNVLTLMQCNSEFKKIYNSILGLTFTKEHLSVIEKYIMHNHLNIQQLFQRKYSLKLLIYFSPPC